MADETYSFTAARARLDEIVTQVRKKDVSLEASLDLLEEGVKLANQCTELIDHVDWVTAAAPSGDTDAAVVSEGEGETDEVTETAGQEGDADSGEADDSAGVADQGDNVDVVAEAETPE